MKCKKHPRYAMKRKPASNCERCLTIWTLKQQTKNLNPMYNITSNGLVTGTVIYDQKGSKMGKVVAVKWEADIRGKSLLTKLTLTIVGASIDAETSDVTIKRKIHKTLPSK